MNTPTHEKLFTVGNYQDSEYGLLDLGEGRVGVIVVETGRDRCDTDIGGYGVTHVALSQETAVVPQHDCSYVCLDDHIPRLLADEDLWVPTGRTTVTCTNGTPTGKTMTEVRWTDAAKGKFITLAELGWIEREVKSIEEQAWLDMPDDGPSLS